MEIILDYCIVLCLGIFAGFIYSRTGSYNKNMVITLSVLPIIVYGVLSAVNGNLGGAVAVLGVFSLIRFRSIPGNSRDILSVFYSMSIGIICLSNLIYGAIFSIILGFIILCLFKSNFGKTKENFQNLKILIPEDLNYIDLFDETFSKYLKSYELEQVELTNMGSMFKLKYKILFKDNINEKEFLDELRCKNGNLQIVINKTQKNDQVLL